jgi:hypothetical protein
MIFMETVNALGLRPGDPELLMAAANASMVVSLAELPRTMARELAQGEYTAAASLRAAAIHDEVRALRGATADRKRASQAAEAQGIATAQTPADDEPERNTGRGWRAPTPAGALAVTVVLLVGVFLGASLTKRTYAGWRTPISYRSVDGKCLNELGSHRPRTIIVQ